MGGQPLDGGSPHIGQPCRLLQNYLKTSLEPAYLFTYQKRTYLFTELGSTQLRPVIFFYYKGLHIYYVIVLTKDFLDGGDRHP